MESLGSKKYKNALKQALSGAQESEVWQTCHQSESVDRSGRLGIG